MTDKPRTRKEMYLAAIAGEDVIPPKPLSREEQYLYKIAMGGRPGGSRGDDAPFELIETITVSEAVKEIERTAEPDGTPYNFRKVFLKITWGVMSSSDNGLLYTNWGEFPVARLGLYNKNKLTALLEVKNGRGFAENTPNMDTATNDYNKLITIGGAGWYECDAITLLKFVFNNNIPVGSTFEIYAVRK